MLVSVVVRYRLLLLRQRRQSRNLRKRYWVHPINALRDEHGAFYTLYNELRQYPDKFEDYLRMSPEAFDSLLSYVCEDIRRQDTRFRRCVCPEQRLLVTLRFLSTGESFASLHFQYRLGKSTICSIVHETCKILWQNLQPEFLPVPTPEQWLKISDKFYQLANFPNCVGAVDGKHIRIVKPAHSGSSFYNYKKYFSIILMAIADARYRFIAVDVGAFGRTNDSRVFKESNMGKRVYQNNFGIPEPRPLPGTQGPPLPLVLVGDEAFQMSTNLMKPYASRTLNPTRRIFNYRLTRARRYVECTFGILTNKWRVLTTSIQMHPENVDEVIKACVILHNFVSRFDPLLVDPNDCESNLPSLDQPALRSTTSVARIRDNFAAYFVSPEGRVPWQDNI